MEEKGRGEEKREESIIIFLLAYMDQNMWTNGAKHLFHTGVVAVFSAEPKEVSMFFFLHYCRFVPQHKIK
jgi:hypothetical protein